MQLWKSSSSELFDKAKARSVRSDVEGNANWIIRGDGPRILFVHGFRGDHHGLMAIAGALPEAEVWMPDLPGYGKTPAFEHEHNLENYGHWLNDYISKAGSFDLVLGHSFGTLVTASAMSKGLKAKTVLLNPITSRATEIGGAGQKLAQRYYLMGERRPQLLASPAVVRGMSMLLTKSGSPAIRSFSHQQHARYFSSYQQPRVVLEGFRAASSGNVFDYLESLSAPLLLIAGERDIVAPTEKTVELAKRIPNSQLEVIPKVGHLTHYETPAEVARLVAGFIEE